MSTTFHIEYIQFDDGFKTTLEDFQSWQLGTANADSLTGTSSHDTMIGYAGNDTLSGGDGSDLLVGGDGNDLIHGQDGLDTMYGGVGADTFTFEAATAYNNIDVIKDFNTS